MDDLNRSLLETLRSLRVALRPTSDLGPLFDARDRIHDLALELEGAGATRLSPICTTIERLLSEVLRRGDVSDAEALAIAEELVRFVERELVQPAERATDGPARMRGRSSRPQVVHGGPSPAREVAAAVESEPRLPGPAGPTEAPDDPGPAPDPEPQTRPGAWVQLDLDDVDESRLGEILLQAGRLSSASLIRALAVQQVSRRRLGDVLVGMGFVSSGDVREALDRQRDLTLRMAGTLQGHPGGLELHVGDDGLGRDDDAAAG